MFIPSAGITTSNKPYVDLVVITYVIQHIPVIKNSINQNLFLLPIINAAVSSSIAAI